LNPLFLRGASPVRGAQFCFSCHLPEKYVVFPVHDQKEVDASEGRCLFCHKAIPRAEKGMHSFELRAGEVRTCRVCHVKRDHPEGKDHCGIPATLEPGAAGTFVLRGKVNPGLKIQEGDRIWILPLGPEKRVGCSTCHDPHPGQKDSKFLLRVQEVEILCRGCHADEEGEESR
jgi:predicted CXXCH cytochrome family protein